LAKREEGNFKIFLKREKFFRHSLAKTGFKTLHIQKYTSRIQIRKSKIDLNIMALRIGSRNIP